MVLTRLIAFVVIAYGLTIVAGSLLREIHGMHLRHDFDTLIIGLPLLLGVSYAYLGSLLLRRKYNAWITAVGLSVVTIVINILQTVHLQPLHRPASALLRIGLPALILLLLFASRAAFQVKSDIRSFRQAVRISLVLLLVAFLYGVGGFMLLDKRDFHRNINLLGAVHQTIDQFGLTTNLVEAHSQRARLFLDSLSIISIAATAYTVISFFQPLRMRLSNQDEQRLLAENLLAKYPSDIDDYFKLWPHDKHYYFDGSGRAGLAYHVSRGVALIVGDPFGDPKRFLHLCREFSELCFVNDWLPSYIHVSPRHSRLYTKQGFRLQKIGEEAVLDLEEFKEIKNNKYFRQINNRFEKLGYHVELLRPPHTKATLQRLRQISEEWLKQPGRAERGFMMGYYSEAYMQACPVIVAVDNDKKVQGFINLVATHEPGTANYDLLRCSSAAPGNCNDFLLLGLIGNLQNHGVKKLNLGLCPLAGLDEKAEDATLVDAALRFVYANGDRFYSFNGLRRFKAKYKPQWENRYIAYPGGIGSFTRVLAALNRAMRVK